MHFTRTLYGRHCSATGYRHEPSLTCAIICLILVGSFEASTSEIVKSDSRMAHFQDLDHYVTELQTEEGKTFNTTFTFSSKGGIEKAPILFFFNGASCESWEYSEFLDELAKLGFLSVVTDFWQPPGPFPTQPGCPKDKVVFVSTEIWDPILLFLENLEKGEQTSEQESLFNALQKTSKKDFVLVAHSYGGAIAIELMNGKGISHKNVQIQGTIVYEGGTQGKISFPESQFMVYMTSTISKSDIQDFYEETTGLKDFIVLEDCNHFGINNFHPERKYMVAPCARALNDKTAYFETTRARQNKVIETLAGLSRLEILSRVMDDEVARKDLKNLTRTFELVIEASIDPFKDVSSVQSCENSPQKDVLST